jgi:DNA-directed RNA polymerase subunit beta'
LLALDAKELTTQTPIKMRYKGDLKDLTQERDTQDVMRATVQHNVNRVINTTVGRVIFNDSIPAGLPYINGTLKKKGLTAIVNYCHLRLGHEMTVKMLDDLKTLGFQFATRAGISIGIDDLVTPDAKKVLVGKAESDVIEVDKQYRDGVITNGERYNKVIAIWSEVTDKVAKEMFRAMDKREKDTNELNPILIMSDSGRAVRPADSPVGGYARPDGKAFGRNHRDADSFQLPRRSERVAILHLDARRAQRSGGYGVEDCRLRLSHASSRGRGAGRDHL